MDYTFKGEIASQFGLPEAVFIHYIFWWMAKNEANGKHNYDGRTWTYNSMEAFSKLFPFWTVAQIRHIINKLKTEGVLLTGNFNKIGFDRTQWFSLSDYALSLYQEKAICQNSQMDLLNLANGFAKNSTPIPVNKPINNIYISSNSSESDNRVSISDWFDKTYKDYPRHEGKTKGLAYYKAYLTKGREINGQRVHLNHHQMLIAVRCYADEMQGKDKQYIQLFNTFMNSTILDYCDKTSEDYAEFMQEKYGEEWQKVRFRFA